MWTRGDITVSVGGGQCDAKQGGRSCVPAPNNLGTAFTEFPSIPRIAIFADAIVTRGNHQPVWAHDETRSGTSGVYADLAAGAPEGAAIAGASKLGAVSGFEAYAVPGVSEVIPFDVFPGAPSITDTGVIAFKGNYTHGGPQTGVFYRYLEAASGGGGSSVQLIANSATEIPNLAQCDSHARTTFGSTAPPSAATDWRGNDHMVFVGLDLEEAPQCGGIYRAALSPERAPLSSEPTLTTLVSLGAPVPGEPSASFTRLGEGLSYDGNFVGFWGAWGTQTRTVRLYCPMEGNRDRIAYCNNELVDPGTGAVLGDPNSICDDTTDDTDACYQEMQVPVTQGIFVHDTRAGKTYLIASTATGFDDFVYWVYSGRVPTTGHGEEDDDGEAARWRSSAFVAVSGLAANVRVAFKARTGSLDPDDHTWAEFVDGLYYARKPGRAPITKIVDTLTPARVLDKSAPVDARVVELGLERDGLRGLSFAISAKMSGPENAEYEDLAGIYFTWLP
jgi:hypothetical protein